MPSNSTEHCGVISVLFVWSLECLGKAFFFLEINMAWNLLGLTIIWFYCIQSIAFYDSSVRISIKSSIPVANADRVLSLV